MSWFWWLKGWKVSRKTFQKYTQIHNPATWGKMFFLLTGSLSTWICLRWFFHFFFFTAVDHPMKPPVGRLIFFGTFSKHDWRVENLSKFTRKLSLFQESAALMNFQVVVSNIFYVHPYFGKWSKLNWLIFFRWVGSTTRNSFWAAWGWYIFLSSKNLPQTWREEVFQHPFFSGIGK